MLILKRYQDGIIGPDIMLRSSQKSEVLINTVPYPHLPVTKAIYMTYSAIHLISVGLLGQPR